MTEQEKKAFMLLKSVVFHYHGLDEEESKNLEQTADELDAHEELEWANAFIAEDYVNSFDRARVYLNEHMGDLPKDTRIQYIYDTWKANCLKGYITEMEATALLSLARDWNIADELIARVKAGL